MAGAVTWIAAVIFGIVEIRGAMEAPVAAAEEAGATATSGQDLADIEVC